MPEAAIGLRERNKSEKLARITAAARDLFRAKGFEETTAREICQRAGIGTGTLFLYVRDKRELLFLCFEADARRLFAQGKVEAATSSGLVAAAQASGEIRGDLSPASAAMALFAHYAYWTLGWLGTGMLARESVEPGLRRALELQIEGLRPTHEQRR